MTLASTHMKIVIFILVLVLQIKITSGQSPIAKTEIIIIGTVHTGNKYFDHRSLYNILGKYNPDIILNEQDTDFKRVFGLRTANFLKIWKPGIEQLALQKYSKNNGGVKILGFDTTFSRKKYIREYIKLNNDFFNIMNGLKMIYTDSLLYAYYANKSNEYYSLVFNTNLFRLNQPDVTEMSRKLKQMEKTHILLLGKKYISDTTLVQHFENELEFWEDRNNYMIRKIIKYSKQYAGKKIIILTGHSHKYYLVDKLQELESETIKISEIKED